jgi:hypothetical protein
MNPLNFSLVEAFPIAVREDALACISALPEASPTSDVFSVNVGRASNSSLRKAGTSLRTRSESELTGEYRRPNRAQSQQQPG